MQAISASVGRRPAAADRLVDGEIAQQFPVCVVQEHEQAVELTPRLWIAACLPARAEDHVADALPEGLVRHEVRAIEVGTRVRPSLQLVDVVVAVHEDGHLVVIPRRPVEVEHSRPVPGDTMHGLRDCAEHDRQWVLASTSGQLDKRFDGGDRLSETGCTHHNQVVVTLSLVGDRLRDNSYRR
jgi:hypothetical protein